MQPVRSLILLAVLAAGTACANPPMAERIARLERERAANPSSATTWRSLGIVYYKEGRYDEARRALTEAKRLDPNDGTTALYLGMTAERQNDYAAARDAYTTYLNVGRTSRVRGQLERRLAALQRLELAQEAKQAVAREQQLSATPGSPRTVAVMPLRFTGTDSTLQPLERGLAELLITDLARSSQLTVVERARLQALLDEIKLQRAGVTVPSTNVRAGRLLQAGRVVQGAIAQRGDQLRVDATVVDVPTTSVAGTTNGDAAIDQLFTLEKTIAFGLFNTLGVTLTAAERQAIEQRPTRSLQAFLAYSRGLSLEDQGRYEDAARSFGDAFRLDPGFTAAQSKSANATAAAQGSSINVVAIEANLAGTPEEQAAQQAQQGNAPGGGGENAPQNVANDLNGSQAAGATDNAGAGGGQTPAGSQPTRDPLASGVGSEARTGTGKVTIVVKIPTAVRAP